MRDVGLLNTYPGLILAHTALATPFVVITVTATLIGFDHSLSRAAAGLGAPPITVFFKVILPLILPGMISGALFAFVTSFDEVVVVLFSPAPSSAPCPSRCSAGIREMISPTITAAATVLILFSIAHADHGRAAAPALRTAAGDQGLGFGFISGYFPESARGCTYLVDWAVRPALLREGGVRGGSTSLKAAGGRRT